MFKYLSAPCGAGKTTAICKKIEQSNDNYIIVQNTIKLIEQTSKLIADSRMIISDSIDESVLNRTTQFLMSPTNRVLIISDKAFFRLSIDLLNGWEIVLDDVTTFHTFKNINERTKSIKNVIHDDVFIDYDFIGGEEQYCTAKKKDVEGDIISKLAKEFTMIDENDIFIMNGDWFSTDKEQLNITAWKDLKKYIDLDITFMSANFENSLIYMAHKELFTAIKLDGLLERKVPVQDRLKVYYFSEKKMLSKTWKKNNKENLDKVYQYLDSTLEGKEYYWTNNNSDSQKLSGGERISPDARGLNEYQKYNTCVWLACMRPYQIEATQCELFFGFTSTEIHQAREYESLHQFVMRGCVRNYNADSVQVVYVFDREQALSLTNNVEYIDIGIDDIEVKSNGRPSKEYKLSDKHRKRVSRFLSTECTLDDFVKWLNSSTNNDLSEKDRIEMMNRFESYCHKHQQ
ncbi:type III restriction endonuclease subunit R [Pectobacterium brasiliense]|uniref:type III restriction endonuclease subunit R n=1 Tax=Pectobacterium brasiliense TaxID=180957 RepID=UPI003813A36E